MYSVYIHVFPNEKVYIGITRNNINHRWGNGSGYKNQSLMYRAIQKYGWENIKHIILFSGLSKEEAEKKEMELISFYKATDPQKGYNLDNGGSTPERFTDETRKKISEWHKGKRQSKETIEKRRLALIKAHANGKFDNADRSFFQTQEYKDKKARLMLEYWRNDNNRKKMCEAVKLSRNKEDYKRIHGAIMKQICNRPEIKAKFTGANNGKSKQCICVETGVVYPCVAEASRQTSASVNSIAMCCRGERKIAGGFHWRYKTDFKMVLGGG